MPELSRAGGGQQRRYAVYMMAVSVDNLKVPVEKWNARLSRHTRLERRCQTAVGPPDSEGFVSDVCDSRRCRIRKHDANLVTLKLP